MSRFGRDGDGGYLVCDDDVTKCDKLMAFGVNDDWSFERDFLRRKPVKLAAFDASISIKTFAKSFLKNSNRFDKPRLVVKSLLLIIDYLLFFRDNRQHFQYFVGKQNSSKFISLNEACEKAKATSNDKIFFKIDIEGSEYRLLDELIDAQSNTTGLVIEFHDCDLHIDRITNFINAYALDVIHVRCNNSCNIGLNGIPTVLEITFSSSNRGEDYFGLPHPLDQPNDPNKPDFKLSFNN